MRDFKFEVEYFKNMVNIDTGNNQRLDDFIYGNILNMYKTDSTQGHGIQVNSEEFEESLLKMCDKISNAVYEYVEETRDA